MLDVFPGQVNVMMVPCLDLINHQHGASVLQMEEADAPESKGTREVVMRASRTFHKGDQVYISYGPYSMENAFAVYGFASSEMPLWMMFNTGKEDIPADAVGMEFALSEGCDRLSASKFAGNNFEFLDRLVLCARAVEVLPEEMEALGEDFGMLLAPVDMDVEGRALRRVMKMIRLGQAMHSETLEDDEERLTQKGVSRGEALVLSLRVQEKSWLADQLEEIKTRWATAMYRMDMISQGMDPDSGDEL